MRRPWLAHWDVTQFLTDADLDDAAAHAVGVQIADYIEGKLKGQPGSIAGPFALGDVIAQLRAARSEAEVNDALDRAYDAADVARVWMSGPERVGAFG